MTEVQKAHAEYRNQINEISEINEEIESVDNAIQALQSQINEAQVSISTINDKLLTATQDMADGSLSSEEYMDLKKALRDKKGIIEDLSEVIVIQNTARLTLAGDGRRYPDDSKLGKAKGKLERLRIDLVKALTKQAVDKVVLAAKDEIKELAYLVASDEKFNHASKELGGDLYTDLGKSLCFPAFDTREDAAYPTVTFKQSREKCRDVIEELNTAN